MTATIADSNLSALQSGGVVETVKVPMRTLDSYQLSNVGFIKIDVEGHEEAVLHGSSETLRREMPNLMIEIEDRTSRAGIAFPAAFGLAARYGLCRILPCRSNPASCGRV